LTGARAEASSAKVLGLGLRGEGEEGERESEDAGASSSAPFDIGVRPGLQRRRTCGRSGLPGNSRNDRTQRASSGMPSIRPFTTSPRYSPSLLTVGPILGHDLPTAEIMHSHPATASSDHPFGCCVCRLYVLATHAGRFATFGGGRMGSSRSCEMGARSSQSMSRRSQMIGASGRGR
jgi:hypothetical protein